MLYIWKGVIPATIEEILKDLKEETAGMGLFREIKDEGQDVMCNCPFHKGGKESKPSFGISKYEVKRGDRVFPQGTCHCFTCGYRSDLPKFVADVLGFDNAVAGYKYLNEKYSYGEDGQRGEIELHLDREEVDEETPINLETLRWYQEELLKSDKAKNYLIGRKLDLNICIQFGFGYNPIKDSIVMPIKNRNGEVKLIKERLIERKTFLNTTGSDKANYIFGLYEAIEESKKRPTEPVWVVESEIDALTIWTWGGIAVAIMGSHISDNQVKEISKSPFRKIIAGGDNDEAGRTGNRKLKDKLIPKGFRIFNIKWATDKKDVNELNVNDFKTKLIIF